MIWKEHSVPDSHAFLSASKHAWTNYDYDRLEAAFKNHTAAKHGERLHAWAAETIKLGMKQKGRGTIALYINDAIGYRMDVERILYYSGNCYGTCDAICFTKDFLRIHDLKTGVTPASMRQLEVYASLFCLEYLKDPNAIGMELRIYQSDQVLVHSPDPLDIKRIMDKIIDSDAFLEKLKIEG